MENLSTSRASQPMKQPSTKRSSNPLKARDNNQMPLQLSNAKFDKSHTIKDPGRQPFDAKKHVLLPAMSRQTNSRDSAPYNFSSSNDENSCPENSIRLYADKAATETGNVQNATAAFVSKAMQHQDVRSESFAAKSTTPSCQDTSFTPQPIYYADEDGVSNLFKCDQLRDISNASDSGPISVNDISDSAKKCYPVVTKSATMPGNVDASSQETQNTEPSPLSPIRRVSLDMYKQTYSPADSSQKSQTKETRASEPRKTSYKRKQSESALYQTCDDIWTETQVDFGEFSYEDIQSLTNLLKTRLAQAKYRALNTAEYSSLREECLAEEDSLTILVDEKKPIRLLYKHHQAAPRCTLTRVGNGRNLFTEKRPKLTTEMYIDLPEKSNISKKRYLENISQNKQPQKKQRKVTNGKFQKESPELLKRKAAAREAVKSVEAVTLKDGTKAWVCAPCDKKYKNKNGLVYHLQRCKYLEHDDATNTLLISKVYGESQRSDDRSVEEDELVDDDPEEEHSKINCICDKPKTDVGTMIQCDKCNTWYHLACTGLTKQDLDDDHYCIRCVQSKQSTPGASSPGHKSVSEEEYELEDDSDTPSDGRTTPRIKEMQPVEQSKETAEATTPVLNIPEVIETTSIEPTPASVTTEEASLAIATALDESSFAFASEPAYGEASSQLFSEQQFMSEPAFGDSSSQQFNELQFMSEPLIQNYINNGSGNNNYNSGSDTQMISTDDNVDPVEFYTTWSPSDLGLLPPSLLCSDLTALDDFSDPFVSNGS